MSGVKSVQALGLVHLSFTLLSRYYINAIKTFSHISSAYVNVVIYG